MRALAELEGKGGEINFFWVKAHADIPGNERADELAKEAALKSKTAPRYDCFPLSAARRAIRENTIGHYRQDRYETSVTGAVTRMFLPDVREVKIMMGGRAFTNMEAQLLTGHGGFKAYLHRFRLADSPHCICDGETGETLEHIPFECPRFSSSTTANAEWGFSWTQPNHGSGGDE